MKISRKLLVTVALLVACASSGNAASVGVFFDSDGTVVCLPDSNGVVVHAYVVVKELASEDGICGWQGEISMDDGLFAVGFVFPTNALNFREVPNVQVAFGNCLPYGNQVVVCEFDLIVTSSGGVFLRPLSGDLYAYPMYIKSDGQMTMDFLRLEYGGDGSPCAVLGGLPCPERNPTLGLVPSMNSTWGDIKAQYRGQN